MIVPPFCTPSSFILCCLFSVTWSFAISWLFWLLLCSVQYLYMPIPTFHVNFETVILTSLFASVYSCRSSRIFVFINFLNSSFVLCVFMLSSLLSLYILYLPYLFICCFFIFVGVFKQVKSEVLVSILMFSCLVPLLYVYLYLFYCTRLLV